MVEGTGPSTWREGAAQSITVIVVVLMLMTGFYTAQYWSFKRDMTKSEKEREAEAKAVRSLLIAATTADRNAAEKDSNSNDDSQPKHSRTDADTSINNQDAQQTIVEPVQSF